jgi:hypothetical protein
MQVRKNGQTASIRTRKVINKFGPEFISLDNQNRPGWLLLRSAKGWFGWLPEKEIILEK